MNNVTIVAEAGSTWLGKKEYGFELIDIAKSCGATYVKFQLFGEGSEYDTQGNIHLPYHLFTEFFRHGERVGIPVTASSFDLESLQFLFSLNVPFIKFAYSQKSRVDHMKATINMGKKAVVSCDPMSAFDLPKNVVKLFIETSEGVPEYPNTKKMNYEGLFPDRFQGLSDHSFGSSQAIEAINQGCEWIEKHFRLQYSDCDTVPDGKFALTPIQFEKFVKDCRT